MIKAYLNIGLRYILKLVLMIYHIFPIQKETIMFDSFFGKNYSDNAKYIFEYICSYYPGKYKLVWGFKNPDDYKGIRGLTPVKYRSLKWFYYHAVAKVVIYSHHIYNYLPIRKNQISIMTWHAGGAYKRIGENVVSNNRTNQMLHRFRNSYINKAVDLFVSSSEIFTKYNIDEVYSYTGCVLKAGLPRNDLLLNDEKRAEMSAKVREKLNTNEVVILYAPTFRTDMGQIDTIVDCDRVIQTVEKRYGREATLLFRSHYYDRHKYENGSQVIDVSNYSDTQELLCAADILITDYSSVIWDFALIGKPCFLYVPDLEIYRDKLQGFFTPIETWPGIICSDMNELEKQIEISDETISKQIANTHLKFANSYEKGNARKQLVDEILRRMGD